MTSPRPGSPPSSESGEWRRPAAPSLALPSSAGEPQRHISIQAPVSAPPSVHMRTTADAVACMKLEELRAQSRAIGERMYYAGPGAKRPRKVEALPDSNPAKKKLKKNMSAYVSRFAAKEYEGLLAKTVSESERELSKALSLRDDTQRDNLIMREQVARLQAQVAASQSGNRGVAGGGAAPFSAPPEVPPTVWRTSALSLPVPERQLPTRFTSSKTTTRDSVSNPIVETRAPAETKGAFPPSSGSLATSKQTGPDASGATAHRAPSVGSTDGARGVSTLPTPVLSLPGSAVVIPHEVTSSAPPLNSSASRSGGGQSRPNPRFRAVKIAPAAGKPNASNGSASVRAANASSRHDARNETSAVARSPVRSFEKDDHDMSHLATDGRNHSTQRHDSSRRTTFSHSAPPRKNPAARRGHEPTVTVGEVARPAATAAVALDQNRAGATGKSGVHVMKGARSYRRTSRRKSANSSGSSTGGAVVEKASREAKGRPSRRASTKTDDLPSGAQDEDAEYMNHQFSEGMSIGVDDSRSFPNVAVKPDSRTGKGRVTRASSRAQTRPNDAPVRDSSETSSESEAHPDIFDEDMKGSRTRKPSSDDSRVNHGHMAGSSRVLDKMRAAGVPAEVAALLPATTSDEVIAKVAEKKDELVAAAAAAAEEYAAEKHDSQSDSSRNPRSEKVGLLIRACERVLPMPLMRWLDK